MTLRSFADRKNIPLNRVQVNVLHQRASLESKDIFIRTIIIEGHLDDATRAKLLEVADLCPVSKTLMRGLARFWNHAVWPALGGPGAQDQPPPAAVTSVSTESTCGNNFPS